MLIKRHEHYTGVPDHYTGVPDDADDRVNKRSPQILHAHRGFNLTAARPRNLAVGFVSPLTPADLQILQSHLTMVYASENMLAFQSQCRHTLVMDGQLIVGPGHSFLVWRRETFF